MRFKYLFFIISIFWFATSAVLAGDMKNVKSLLNNADHQAENMTATLPENDAAQKAARKVMQTFDSPAYQNKLHDEIARLKSTLLQEDPNKKERKQVGRPNGQNMFLLPDERIYIFISSSIPMSTLKNYAADIDRLNDPRVTMVMRGFVNGMQKIKPTMEFIRSLIKKDPQCDDLANCPVYNVSINIDPMLFSRYGIDSVPAILYADGVNSFDAQKSEGIAENTAIENAYIVHGDVSLEYALNVIEGQTHNDQITGILKKLRKGFYN